MGLLTDERVPEGTDKRLAEYLNRMFRDARLSDDQSDQFLVRTIIPEKLNVGKPYYFGAAVVGTDINEEGWYFQKSDGNWYHFADICTQGAWEDNTADLTSAKSIGTAPTMIAVNSGFYQVPDLTGTPTRRLQAAYHIKHDVKQNSFLWPHIHWLTDGVNAGTVTWRLSYQYALGHDQGNFPAPVDIDIAHTIAPAAAWRHYISEGTVANQSIAMPEVDSLLFITVEILTNTVSGDSICPFYMDLHYERERISTISKAPDFYV